MYALMVLGAFGLYCLLGYGLIRAVLSSIDAQRHVLRRFTAFIGIIVVGSPAIYYALLPAMVKPLYCRDAGFWLYKSPEQWKRENPCVAETLKKDGRSFTRFNDKTGLYEGGYILNQRFEWHTMGWNHWHNLQTSEQRVVDSATGEVMARRLDFGWNLPRPLKIGGAGTCFRKSDRERWLVGGEAFYSIYLKFKNIKENES